MQNSVAYPRISLLEMPILGFLVENQSLMAKLVEILILDNPWTARNILK